MTQPWFFEDFSEGQTLPAGDTTVLAEDAAWFAAAFGSRGVEAAPWTVPPRSGSGLSEWHVSALGMRMIFDTFIGRTASVGAPGVEVVEWPHPVLVGDRLRLETTVSTLRASRSRPEMGLVGFEFTLLNQDGACVMRQTNVILVQRRTVGKDDR